MGQIIPTPETDTHKTKVLFVCTHNSARSQIGEGLLRHHAGDYLAVFSAGLEAAAEIHPMAIQVMDEIGIDIRSQRPKPTKQYMGRLQVDYLITVCSQAEADCPRALWAGKTTRLSWTFDDPAEAGLSDSERIARFRSVRDGLQDKIQAWLTELRVKGMLADATGDTA
jgi:arsenate reductase